MASTRRAVIDVGTNSIKLLVADVTGLEICPVREESRQTRLGQGFYTTHRLRPEPIALSAQAVAEFAVAARANGAASIRVVATSAARDAVNAADLVQAIQQAAGLAVEIISGEQEADWAFQGVTTDPKLAGQPVLILDVGGGSTEFILGQGERRHFRNSFPLGTVRLLEKTPHGDPPSELEFSDCWNGLREFLGGEVRPLLRPALDREGQLGKVSLIGTGGTATILARMEAKMNDFDRDRIESVRLTMARLREHLRNLWSLPIERRRLIAGLPPKRADVILMGAAIYTAVMEEFGFDELRVSTRGLRYAAVMEIV